MKNLILTVFLVLASATAMAAEFCATTCENDIQVVKELVDMGGGRFRCMNKFNVACAPYACANANECKKSCATSNDCTAGYGCNSVGKCAPRTSWCRDSVTVQSSNDTLTSCAPYRCLSGQCLIFCSSNADCQGAKCVNQRCQ